MNDNLETLAPRGSKAWWARPVVWFVTVGVASIMVIEGFALSWGSGDTPEAKRSSHTMVTLAQQPSYQATCRGNPTYLDVEYERFGPFGPAFLAGKSVPVVISGPELKYECGGANDGSFYHLQTEASFVLSPKVNIELLENSTVYYRASLKQLTDYLAADPDRNYFLVVGPPSGVTTLRAMYVP